VASEFTLGASLAYEDDEGTDISEILADIVDSITTKKFIHAKPEIGLSEEALALGEVTALGWALFINRDETNYLEIRSASGAGNDIIKIKPGKFALFHFGSDVTAPYAVANTAACKLEYWIFAA
jgi:hypothetical protein